MNIKKYFLKNIFSIKILSKKIKFKLKFWIKKTFFFNMLKKLLFFFKNKKNILQQHFTHKRKERTILFYKKKYNIHTLLETGTYQGEMIMAMLNHFNKLYSIELSISLFEKAKEKFKNNKKVQLFQGDSGDILQQILVKIDTPCLFWLDAHYSKGITARGLLETPIIKELENIFQRKNINDVILVDDARCFNGTKDYPTIENLRKYVLSKNNNLEFKISGDIIRICHKI
ncbi:hypothetical protein KJ991_01620 [Patescibacteria group bacterium]|nr:hypothetical protein [Patescibacteria group bacterium]MBU4115774.1 hypothetical protein [Patescibacteria group bacterium]